MQLQVIGYLAPYPKINEACSGYLIKNKNTNILIDCGHSVFSHLQKYIKFTDLDAVIISHFHPDHYVDLYALRHALGGATRSGEITFKPKLFIPSEPSDLYNYFLETDEFEVNLIGENKNYLVEELDLTFHKTIHPKMCYGVKIQNDNSSMYYTADTAYDENGIKFSKDVNLIIAEASLLEDDQQYSKQLGHMTAKEVGLWATKANTKRLIPSHIWPEFTSEQIVQLIKPVYQGDLVVPYSGLIVNC
ncbi:hypothetical protein SYNTR_0281 [Candidatus Syntrophocurvum alkaliphilum]|uniref:Metallo-beta-lactamase domain-containing protein n=2 Tax=Candidatus Syntrophocurvum alkaliphilum TaxID=2293317 RepID=A0A6I6DBP1_9FIRM|nr:hypothetical protein SYNTR_0281 [Candidatus Syntrophocurvum alkaliphilum]